MHSEIEKRFLELGGMKPIDRNMNSFTPMSEDDIDQVESALNGKFPSDYRDFLSKYGGCTLSKICVCELPSDANPSGEKFAYISMFRGANDIPRSSLNTALNRFSDKMPEGMVSIADDNGNQICLSLFNDSNEYGKIFYWSSYGSWDANEYEDEHGEQMPRHAKFINLYKLADSFRDLLNQMQILDNEA
jgi:hypothetical protein